jgi:hypothetical protein
MQLIIPGNSRNQKRIPPKRRKKHNDEWIQRRILPRRGYQYLCLTNRTEVVPKLIQDARNHDRDAGIYTLFMPEKMTRFEYNLRIYIITLVPLKLPSGSDIVTFRSNSSSCGILLLLLWGVIDHDGGLDAKQIFKA